MSPTSCEKCGLDPIQDRIPNIHSWSSIRRPIPAPEELRSPTAEPWIITPAELDSHRSLKPDRHHPPLGEKGYFSKIFY
jgi:hypothetical protein